MSSTDVLLSRMQMYTAIVFPFGTLLSELVLCAVMERMCFPAEGSK